MNSSQEFQLSDLSLLMLITKNAKKIGPEDIKETIPPELMDHKYLIHPVRMSILKLLILNDQLPSSEIRQLLGITWGEYYSNLKSMEERGYIEVENTLNLEANLLVTIEITELGRSSYEELIELLKLFTDREAPIRRLMGKNPVPIYDTSEYPKNIDELE